MRALALCGIVLISALAGAMYMGPALAQTSDTAYVSPWVVLGGVLAFLTFLLTIGTVVWRTNSHIASAKREAIDEALSRVRGDIASRLETEVMQSIQLLRQELKNVETNLTTKITYQLDMMKQQTASEREVLNGQIKALRNEFKVEVQQEITKCPYAKNHIGLLPQTMQK